MTEQLTEDQEQELVDFLASNPIYYDQVQKDFKHRAKKSQLANQKGPEMGMTGGYFF